MDVHGVQGVPDYRVDEFGARGHDFALVIPVLNENGRIRRQLAAIQQGAPDVDVVIADGGSTDGSLDAVGELGVRTVLTKTGPGKLSAQLRMAFHYCLEQGYDAVITMDGNAKDGPEGIQVLADAMRQGYDFVQGSRFVPGGVAINTPRSRHAAIRVVHAPVTSAAAGKWYTDTTNGFRGHSRRLLTDPRVSPLRDVFETYELLAYLPIRAARLHMRVTEVPVRREYPENEPTPTKISGWSGNTELLGILARAATGRYNP